MIAPLDIDRVMFHEAFDDNIGTLAAVEKVADDMELVDNEPLDNGRERDNHVLRAPNLDHRLNQLLIVFLALRVLRVDQLVQDKVVFFRDRATDLLPRIFNRNQDDFDE